MTKTATPIPDFEDLNFQLFEFTSNPGSRISDLNVLTAREDGWVTLIIKQE
jgi:hypothetical protein